MERCFSFGVCKVSGCQKARGKAGSGSGRPAGLPSALVATASKRAAFTPHLVNAALLAESPARTHVWPPRWQQHLTGRSDVAKRKQALLALTRGLLLLALHREAPEDSAAPLALKKSSKAVAATRLFTSAAGCRAVPAAALYASVTASPSMRTREATSSLSPCCSWAACQGCGRREGEAGGKDRGGGPVRRGVKLAVWQEG